MKPLDMVGVRKVRVSATGVASFNRSWPCSGLRSTRAYWFEFDNDGNLVDTDVPESDDGAAASALSIDCQRWLFEQEDPTWLP